MPKAQRIQIKAPRFKGRPSELRSKIMSAVRAKNTTPEMALRKLLSSAGFRYRLHKKNLPGRPDIVFVRQKVVVFCDGDFWHGRNWKARLARKEFNIRKNYWIPKIESNIARDRRNNRHLRKLGWTVLRFWESDIKKRGPLIALKVAKALKSAY